MILCVIIFSLPTAAISVPWDESFDIKYLNYAPITVLIVIIAVGLWWLISAKNTFEGPIRQIATDDTGRVIDEEAIAEVEAGHRSPGFRDGGYLRWISTNYARRSRQARSTPSCWRSPTWKDASRAND